MNLAEYFLDPLLRGPTIGSVLMCATSAMVGVIAVLRRRALLGESLSHAAYPGVLIALSILGSVGAATSDWLITLAVFLGASATACLGLILIRGLEAKQVKADAALCFVLASLFGLGMLLASRLQFTHAKSYRSAQAYLYGQTATMTDADAWIYGALALLVVFVLFAFYKEIQVLSFDAEYARTLGIRVSIADWTFTALLVGSIVIGLRSVGVVLMSAMLIIPCVTARQFCRRLPSVLGLAAAVGAASALIGVILSVEGSSWLSQRWSQIAVLPTGPIIVLAATFLCVGALLFAPDRGLLTRAMRMVRFRLRCGEENVLKWLWRHEGGGLEGARQALGLGPLEFRIVKSRLVRHGWLTRTGAFWQLSTDGRKRAARIVRLHRLWELYLVDYLGLGVERVHRSAEEIEHILTPDLETRLEALLSNPRFDPHHQPIPPKA
jgi:manganese/zinc/iron transport system permease protein